MLIIISSSALLLADLPRSLQPPPRLNDTWTELLIKTLTLTAARARPPLLLTHNPAVPGWLDDEHVTSLISGHHMISRDTTDYQLISRSLLHLFISVTFAATAGYIAHK